ncbi:Gfo/Idh/MocA family oxidoreductase [Streptacidiphilus fuscans]|uniref:Gfo/Idh/MocA family oxidoreductase n=1 Tax=Streptacidiphilus fuscans TaxID=2789292 RepID=A0A931FDQ5_9ACTN|nr:Gfo/Idh/MocA family oxidoreductase [Streptacidiphilus fuscans]MBF9069798.1 Gfo/Idh/MocA family oxidoreductase [Streptacidiphilus fuscans]
MLRTLVVGLGRAGAGLHLPVLAKARAQQPHLFAPGPVVGVDPHAAPTTGGDAESDADGALRIAESLHAARRLLSPDKTVVHVCTPPLGRPEVIRDLLGVGFRKLLLEKPVAAGTDELTEVVRQMGRPGVQVAVVEPWSASTLTERLARLVSSEADPRGTRLGSLRQISVVQNKPRFQRSLTTYGHPTAFDVETPHALGVVLHLAGDAEVTYASCTDMVLQGRVLPRMGSCSVQLHHRGGVRSEIRSDLTSPVRERRITLQFDHGTVIGHYPADSADDHAQLRLVTPGSASPPKQVFRDDAFTAFLLRAYADFDGEGPPAEAFTRQVRTVELLAEAKRRCDSGLTAELRLIDEVLAHVK